MKLVNAVARLGPSLGFSAPGDTFLDEIRGASDYLQRLNPLEIIRLVPRITRAGYLVDEGAVDRYLQQRDGFRAWEGGGR